MATIILIKFILIFIMAFLFGIERQLSNKPIGFGTFIFVSLGSCALTVVAENTFPGNAISIVGGLVTGIGFLGAGALIKTADKITGFTTAASIWIFSILGIAIGFENYKVASLIYLAIWIVIATDKIFEKNGIGNYQRKITIKTNKLVSKENIISVFKNCKWKLIDLEIDKKNRKQKMVYLITARRDYVASLSKNLTENKDITSFAIE